jgi:hypothetical protein
MSTKNKTKKNSVKTVTVELTEKEFEMLNQMREDKKHIEEVNAYEAKLNALATKYENASVAKLKKDYIKEFGTDPMIDFVKDTDTRELGERFVECISRELLVELYLQQVPQKDLKEWFSVWDGREFMIEKLLNRFSDQQ